MTAMSTRTSTGTVRAAKHAAEERPKRRGRAVVPVSTTAVTSVRAKPARTSGSTTSAKASTTVSTRPSPASRTTALVCVRDILRWVGGGVVLHHGVGRGFLLLVLAFSSGLLLTCSLGSRSRIGSFIVADVLGREGLVVVGPRAVVGRAVLAVPRMGVVVARMRAGAPRTMTLAGRALSPAVPEIWVRKGRPIGGRRWRRMVDAGTTGWVMMFWAVDGFPEGMQVVWPRHDAGVCVCGCRVYVCICVCVCVWMGVYSGMCLLYPSKLVGEDGARQTNRSSSSMLREEALL